MHSWFRLHFPCLAPINTVGFRAAPAELWLQTRAAWGGQGGPGCMLTRSLGVALLGLDTGLFTNFSKANEQSKTGTPGWHEAGRTLFSSGTEVWQFKVVFVGKLRPPRFCATHVAFSGAL